MSISYFMSFSVLFYDFLSDRFWCYLWHYNQCEICDLDEKYIAYKICVCVLLSCGGFRTFLINIELELFGRRWKMHFYWMLIYVGLSMDFVIMVMNQLGRNNLNWWNCGFDNFVVLESYRELIIKFGIFCMMVLLNSSRIDFLLIYNINFIFSWNYYLSALYWLFRQDFNVKKQQWNQLLTFNERKQVKFKNSNFRDKQIK